MDNGTIKLTLLESFIQCPKKNRCKSGCPFRNGWTMTMAQRIEMVEKLSEADRQKLYQKVLHCSAET